MLRPSPIVSAVLLGLLLLGSGPAPTLQPVPAQAQEAKISLEAKWLVLRKEDVGSALVQMPDQTSEDDRGQQFVRRFEPNYRGREDDPPVPKLVLNKLWLANDIGTAQAIFQEQAGAGFPESPSGVGCVGGLDLPGLGEENAGIVGHSPCDSTSIHHRIVFRYLNAVQVLYAYGDEQFAYTGVIMDMAKILGERTRAVPTGPAPDVAWDGSPRTVALSVAELGKQIDPVMEKEGDDGRARWYEVRFKRDKKLETAHVGPLDIYNKVWVARDIDTAREIFAEQAKPHFPEADETVGSGQFEMENLPSVGNDNYGWSACNEDCMTARFRFLHHRYVFRAGTMVAVLYTWGGNQDNSVAQVGYYAQSMRNRMGQ